MIIVIWSYYLDKNLQQNEQIKLFPDNCSERCFERSHVS
jgi:hypothetical protein